MARGVRARQALTRYCFSAVKPRAPENLTIQASTFHTWKLDWSIAYPSSNFLSSTLSYLVNIANEKDPTDVSGGAALHLGTQAGGEPGLGWEVGRTAGPGPTANQGT